MKKIIVFLFLFVGISFGQDVTTTMGWGTNSFRDTLTATIDSIKVNGVGGGVVYTITAYTTTGTDTVNVYSLPMGYTVWAQKSLTDLVSGDLVTQIIVTTTPKEYIVSDPNLVSMLLVTPDGSANCVVIVSKKSGGLALGTQTTKISQFPNSQTYADVRNSWEWARSLTTYIDTVKTDSAAVVRSRDTLTIGGTEWSKITIRGLAATDSLQFAVGTTAPATFQRVFGTTPFVTEKLNKTYFTKVFIKGYGANDSIKSYQVIIEAF